MRFIKIITSSDVYVDLYKVYEIIDSYIKHDIEFYKLKGVKVSMIEEQLELVEPIECTIEDVQEGDLIKSGKYFNRVLGRSGSVVFVSGSWAEGEKETQSFNWTHSISDLKLWNFTIVPETPEEEVLELTVADVEKKFGKKVKIIKE